MSVTVIKKGPEAEQHHKVTCRACKSELSYASSDTFTMQERAGDPVVAYLACPVCHLNIALGSRPR